MSNADLNVLITGGTGGIGMAMTKRLLDDGSAVLVTGRDADALHEVCVRHSDAGDRLLTVQADLASSDDIARLVSVARRWRSGINVLVNNAGASSFGLFESQGAETIARTLQINVMAPMLLTRALLSHLASRPAAQIVNVGSVFGAIGYPGQVAYSASKFALRGFSEALGRELHGTAVRVHYLAPRATDTPMNSPAVAAMNAKLGVHTDSPARVARELARTLRKGWRNRTIGWPEKFFVRINALFPGVVDSSIAKQLDTIRHYAGVNQSCELVEQTVVRPLPVRKVS